MDLGAWTLLPPALAIVFAIATRRVFQALLLGIFTAGILLTGSQALAADTAAGAVPFAALAGGFIQSIKWIVLGIADYYHAGVIAFTLFLGALVALMQRSGGVRGFGEWSADKADTPRKGQVATWGIGAAFLAIDDYFHVIAAGSIFRPVTDRLKISREKLAYIIDSTAAPMVILIPISTWAGVILGQIRTAGVQEPAFGIFLDGIPFNFYAILTVLFVGVVAMTRIEYGPMAKAERRAAAGKLLGDNAKPLVSRELAEMEPVAGATPRLRNLALPVLFLLGSAITMLWVTGYTPGASFVDALYNSEAELSLAIASFLTLLFAMVLYSFQGILSQDEFLDASLDGFKAMVPALAILALAWGIGNAVASSDDGGIGLGDYLAGTVGDSLPASWVPLIAFVLAGVIAFSTGTSFGTFAIMVPVTLPIAYASGGAEWLGPALAASIGGAVFGDHCSPISDTTVMSSMAAQCDHIDHVRTQLPYALTVAVVAIAGYTALGLTGQAWVAWVTNAVLFAGVFGVAWFAARGRPA